MFDDIKDERMKKALAKLQQYFIPRVLGNEVKYFCGDIILLDEEKEKIDGKIYTKKYKK